MKNHYFENEPLWYKDAIIYELHIKAFYDSNDDGIGDFRGLKRKLDYLERLGITAIWLLPFYPSPLRDDGYDIANYLHIHYNYGTIRDFKDFLKAAHQRGIRVITELVLNHTSSDHAWFQRSRQAKPGSSQRDFYVWSDTPEKYKDARIIFKDFETSNWTWDPVANAYYWHRFYAHQPDLNYDNPEVRKAMFKVIDFWFTLGVDGLRLDAVPYLYEREGTNCENLAETHAFLKKLRAHIDEKFTDKMFIAEANQWPEDAAAYFGAGNECHMAFHFPLMPRIFMALQMEDSFPVIDILKTTPEIPRNCQWAIFLRNHDELTLEMVTDEERDYMYRVYAKDPQAKINLGIRRRLAPLLNNDRRKIELMNILLFSLPGTPMIYYGDEIGMGDNYYLGDRNGVRAPMQWSFDKNAGFSRSNPQKLYLPIIIDPEYHYEAVNVENQERNLSSLLWWMRKMISMRKRLKSFSRGTLEILASNNTKVLSFTRQYQEETVLVISNLSKLPQVVELNLSQFSGIIPEEIFSRNDFPPIKETPYVFPLGAYSHFWFLLRKQQEAVSLMPEKKPVQQLKVKGNWGNILRGKQKQKLEEHVLPGYLKTCRWFAAKARAISQVSILEDAPVQKDPYACHLLLVEVSYNEGTDELYLLPLAYIPKVQAPKILEEFPQGIVCSLLVNDDEGILFDGIYDENFHKTVLFTIARRRKIKGQKGEFAGFRGKKLKSLLGEKKFSLASKPLKAEQSNTSLLYEDALFLKLYRRLGDGINPELEIVRFLTEKTTFAHVPPFGGAIEYRQKNEEPITVALLQGYIENIEDAWTFTLDVVGRYFERVLSKRTDIAEMATEYGPLLDIDNSRVPEFMSELIGGLYMEMASLLGKRTAELHLALGSGGSEENFRPEPFSLLYQRSVYQSMRSLVTKTMRTLANNMKRIPENIRNEGEQVLSGEQEILNRLKMILQKKFSAMKIRIHGDYHLGQVLYTGKDFMIMDFEGEPARSLGERRLKRSPFRDVAGMIRSFHYAAYGTLFLRASFRPEDMKLLESWIEPWYYYVSGIFLHSYLNTLRGAPFMPGAKDEMEILLQTFLLEKAVYELGYELNNRPDWIIIPIKGIERIIKKALFIKTTEKE